MRKVEIVLGGMSKSGSENSKLKKDDEIYEVEEIVDRKLENNLVYYLVKWKNYASKDNTWVAKEDIFNCQEMIDAYEQKHNMYYVEKIIDKKLFGGKPKYLVKWKGFSSDQNTWETEQNLNNCRWMVEEFEKSLQKGQKKKKEEKLVKQSKKIIKEPVSKKPKSPSKSPELK